MGLPPQDENAPPTEDEGVPRGVSEQAGCPDPSRPLAFSPQSDGVRDVAPRTGGLQEVDVWWGAYAGRTMLPSFLFCALLTLAAVVVALYLGSRYDLDPLALRYTVYVVAALIWLVQLARWSYRVLTFSYRLTTRRLLLERSFFNSARAAVDLPRIARLNVQQRPVERLLGVGRIYIFEDSKSLPSLELLGVLHPETVANVIREQANTLRKSPPPDPT
jgi:membrane protein YdbS with pleckstrin-like domain